MHHQTSAKTRKAWHLTLPPFYVPFSSLASFKKYGRSSHAGSAYYCRLIFYHCVKILFSEFRQVICIRVSCASHVKELPSCRFLLKTQIRSAGSNIRCLSFFFEEMKSFAMSFALLRPLVFLIIQHPIYFFNSRRTLLKQCPKFHSIGGRRR